MKKRSPRTASAKRQTPSRTKSVHYSVPPSLPRFPAAFMDAMDVHISPWFLSIERALDDCWDVIVDEHSNDRISNDDAEHTFMKLVSAKTSVEFGSIYGFVLEILAAGQSSSPFSFAMRKKLDALHEARVAGGKSRSEGLEDITLEVVSYAKLIYPHYDRHRKLGMAYVNANVPRATFERKLKKIAESKGLDWRQLREDLFLGHFDSLRSESS